MISRRFVVPVCVLLAVACVPTVIHSYLGAVDDDGLRTAAVPTAFNGYTSAPTRRPPGWASGIFASQDWLERNYGSAKGESIRLFVARSHDAKKLYHHPELAVLRGHDFARARPATLRIGEESAPVFVLDATDRPGVAVYALLYDDRYVADPLKFQLESALKLLFSERKAMTLFLAYDPAAPVAAPLEGSAVARVLGEAVTTFRAQKPAAAPRSGDGQGRGT